MAQPKFGALSKATLGKRGNDENLVNKFFHREHMMNLFLHKEGQFTPEALVITIDGQEVEAYESDESDRWQEALTYIRNVVSRGNTRDNIHFTGRFTKSGQIKTAKLTEFLKTEEFGGQGAKKVNAGNLFEKEFEHSLQCKLQCVCKKTKYDTEAQNLLDLIGPTVNGGKQSLAGVKWAGPANQKRTLVEQSKSVVVNTEKKVTEDIGSIVTDITTYWGGHEQNPEYLSLKWGNTLTFINSGVGKVFPENEFKDANFKHPIASALFSTFGIDPVKFSQAFNGYPHATSLGKDTNPKYDKQKMQKLLRYCIGHNYWMVHGGSGPMKMFKVDQTYLNQASSITGGLTIHYGGMSGKGKRVDMTCESSKYKFTWNIRNKQSGKFPSHIMCDYKAK